MRMRVGDLASNAPFGQGANPGASPLAASLLVNAPISHASSSKGSVAAQATATYGAPASFAVTLAPTAAPIASPSKSSASDGACGPEPARKPTNASGAAQFVDGAAGIAYLACLDRQAASAEASRLAQLERRELGGAGGCGPEPAFTMFQGQKQYGTNNAAFGAAWNRCMQSAPVAPPPPNPESVSRPVDLQKAAPLSDSGSAPVYYGDDAPASPSELAKSAPGGDDLQKSPLSVSGSIDIPTEMWIGLGILGAATVLGGIYLATRHGGRRAT